MSTGIVNADAVEEGAFHLGICDGVSGVHHLGIPPDELPKELLRSCGDMLESGSSRPADPADDGTWLTGLIEEAYESTSAYGATTLLLAALRDSNLVTASLGDCALLVLRPSSFQPLRLRSIFKTEPGRYDSRRPVQVQRLHGFSDANAHTVIQGAMVSTTPVQHGDILILGSDGLFDNLRDEDITHTVERCCGVVPSQLQLAESRHDKQAAGKEHLQRTAAALVDLAISRVKLDNNGNSTMAPWSANGTDVPANNADDTTALVSVVLMAESHHIDDEEPLESCAGVIDICGSVSSRNSGGRGVLQDRTNVASRWQRAKEEALKDLLKAEKRANQESSARHDGGGGGARGYTRGSSDIRTQSAGASFIGDRNGTLSSPKHGGRRARGEPNKEECTIS